MFREFISDAILRPVAAMARASAPAPPASAANRTHGTGQAEADYRAAAVASQMIGLALTRYVLRLGPIASASPADLAKTIGPTIDRYMTGDFRSSQSINSRDKRH
jgi:hypothetical protein